MATGSERLPKIWPLVGRTAELGQLQRLVAANAGAAAVLVGPAGVGKSRLGAEALEMARQRGRPALHATATRSATRLPLGALTSLLPADIGEGGGRPGLVRQSLDALRSHERPPLLVIDDAHLLDDVSAVVVQQAAAEGVVTMLATVRAGEPAPDALSALWKEPSATRIDVGPLDRQAVDELLMRVLGGPIEGPARTVGLDHHGGQPFVRALVLGALDAGALVLDRGLWRLRGSPADSLALAELIDARLANSTTEERTALELLAIGEPLGIDLLAELAGTDAVEALERRGLVTVEVDRRRRTVTLSHPLQGELLGARLPAIAGLRYRRMLADAAEARGARRRDDTMRVATWRLEGGGRPRPGLLFAAAKRAFAARDLPLAERLARASWESDASFDAGLLLHSALAEIGQASEADEALAFLEPIASDDAERALLAIARSLHLFWALGRREDAELVLDRAAALVAPGPWADELRAQRATIHVLGGEPAQAAALVADLVDSDSPRVAARAAGAAALAYTFLGRVEQAASTAELGWEVQSTMTDQRGFGSPGYQIILRIVALTEAGHLAEADQLARIAYDVTLASADNVGQGWTALVAGRVALAQGRLIEAATHAGEAVLRFDELGQRSLHRWASATRLLAVAQRGDVKTSDELAARLLEEGPQTLLCFEPDTDRAIAWAEVAHGDLAAARTALTAAAARWCALPVPAAAAAHDLARLGDAAGAVRILDDLDVPPSWAVGAAYHAHATAAAAGDPTELEAASRRFDEMGMALLAAEAAASAAAAWRAAGRASAGQRAATSAAALAEQCGSPVTPALALAGRVGALSSREREAAVLAAEGLTNKAIAERLGLSERTVENHLQRSYLKLGIRGREDLGEHLA